MENKKIPEINIGVFGHVDHGKTTLVQALTGKRTDMHSEEQKRGITIRLGYADATFYKCPKCEDYPYSPTETCPKCFSKCSILRTVSFVDAPGHETLMATVLSGTALIDGALLVIDAREGIREQTKEHLLALNIAGIRNIVIVQNKIDLVGEEEAEKNYKEIKDLVKGTCAENSPIIPVSAQQNINIDALICAIEEHIPTPEKKDYGDAKFLIARSFDVNMPGTPIDKLRGGVIGGSLVRGRLKIGDEIEIKPGAFIGNGWKTLKTRVACIRQANRELEECRPGGLIGLETELDPSLTKADSLAGNVAGFNLPDTLKEVDLRHTLIVKTELKKDESLLITHGVTRTIGTIARAQNGRIKLNLKIPICANPNERVVLSKQISGVWHLIGYGEII